jgi:hypothetical protein
MLVKEIAERGTSASAVPTARFLLAGVPPARLSPAYLNR